MLTTFSINLHIKTDIICYSSIKLTRQVTYYPPVNPAFRVRVNAQSEVQMFVTLSGAGWHPEEHHGR